MLKLQIRSIAKNEALQIEKEDIQMCSKLVITLEIIKKSILKINSKKKINILTHCNAGWLATVIRNALHQYIKLIDTE